MEYNLIEGLAEREIFMPTADDLRTDIIITSLLTGDVLTGKYNPSASQFYHLELLYRLERTNVPALLNLQIGH